LKIGSLVFRFYEFEKTMDIWQQALNYEPKEPAINGWVILQDTVGNGPNISPDQVSCLHIEKC